MTDDVSNKLLSRLQDKARRAKYDAMFEDLAKTLLREADKIKAPYNPRLILTSASGTSVIATALGIALGQGCIEDALRDMTDNPGMSKEEAANANFDTLEAEADNRCDLVEAAAARVVLDWVRGEGPKQSGSVHQFAKTLAQRLHARACISTTFLPFGGLTMRSTRAASASSACAFSAS